MIDLSPAHLAIVKRILAKHVPGYEVRGFGSRATWNAKDHSDLDLAVVGDESLLSRTLARLKEAFEESRLPMRVDVIDWNTIADDFRELIAPDTVVVQEAPQCAEWPSVALSEVVELTLSSVDKKSKPGEHPVLLCNYTDVYNHDFIRAEMDFMSATATDREIGRCSLVEGDVIITKDSEAYNDIGVPSLVRENIPNLLCGYHLAILRAKPKIDGTYLFYALKTREVQQQFHAYANGVTRYGLRKADIGLVELPLPPLGEQRAVARVLSALDEKIELNRRMSETLEEMARALFKSWFVDFDPVRAKAGGRPSGLPPELDALFPASFEVSELEEIPAGWVQETIYRFANIIYGAPFASNQFNTENEGVPLIRIRDLSTHNPKVSTRQIHKKGHLINPGDIVVGMDGAFRLEVWKGPTSWLNQRVCHFEPQPRIPTLFLVGALQEPLAFFERSKVGTTVIYLGKVDLDTIRLLRPSQGILDIFAKMGEPLLEQAVAKICESRTLIGLRDALLPKLISGEIRVGHVEKVWQSET